MTGTKDTKELNFQSSYLCTFVRGNIPMVTSFTPAVHRNSKRFELLDETEKAKKERIATGKPIRTLSV